MPIDYSRYPAYWPKLSKHIRHIRAGNRCEWCSAPNGGYIVRSDVDPARYMEYDVDRDYWLIDGQPVRASEIPDEYGGKAIRVVLTVAHIDHDISNNYFSNLAALCQRCHLTHDADHHAQNAARTRAENKRRELREAGQLSLFEGGEA